MAYKRFELDGVYVNAPMGFSWTTMLFGPFPALFRRDFKGFAIMVAIELLWVFLLDMAGVPDWLTILAHLAFATMYNELYEEGLRKKGFKEVAPPRSLEETGRNP